MVLTQNAIKNKDKFSTCKHCTEPAESSTVDGYGKNAVVTPLCLKHLLEEHEKHHRKLMPIQFLREDWTLRLFGT